MTTKEKLMKILSEIGNRGLKQESIYFPDYVDQIDELYRNEYKDIIETIIKANLDEQNRTYDYDGIAEDIFKLNKFLHGEGE